MADGTLIFKTSLDADGLKSGLKGVFNVSTKAAAVFTGGIAAGAAAFGALTKESLTAVASLEQNIGGVETLFKESADRAIENANRAYKTAGLSADNYMSTITSFAASLLQSLGNDTEAAVDVADMAIIDMSDNANKMGTDMQSIQNAYQGFAKQNYTMLDNLKLGYGGTKEEMQRLLKTANELNEQQGIHTDYQIDSFADIVNAIHVVQTEMGITGTTAKEAATTIEGSVNSAKAAWTNFMDGSGSVDELESTFDTAAEVIVKNLEEIIPRLAKTLPAAIGAVGAQLPSLILLLLPYLIQGGTTLISSFISVIPSLLLSAAPPLFNAVLGLLEQMAAAVAGFDFSVAAQSIINGIAGFISGGSIDRLFQAAGSIVSGIANGILSALPQLIPVAMQALMNFSGYLRENVGNLVDAGLQMIVTLAQSLIDNIPVFVETIPTIITNICGIINDNTPKLLTTGIYLIAQLALGLIKAIPTIVKNIPKIIQAIISVFTAFNWLNLGKTIISGIANGVKSLASSIPAAFRDFCTNAHAIVSNWGWSGLGKTIITLIRNGITSLLSVIPNTLLSIGTNAMSAFRNIDWWSVGSNVIKGICAGISAGIGNLLDMALELGNSLLRTVKEFFGINSPSTVMMEMGGFLVQGLINGIMSLPDQAAQVFANVLLKVLQFGTDMKKRAMEAGSSFLQNVINYIRQLPGQIWSQFSNVISKAANFASDMGRKATEAGKGFYNNIVDALAGLPGKMAEIGSNIVSGIWNGISSGWDWLTNKVSSLANSLFEAAKKALDINSPSKKFAYIGEMCVEGMDEPLRKYNPYGTLKASLLSGEVYLRNNILGRFGLSGNGAVNNVSQTFNIYQPVKTPSELMRAARLEARYGMAGA